MPGRSAYTSFGRFLVFSWRVLGRTSVLVLGGVRLFLPAFKPIPKNTWSRLFLYSSVPVQNKLEKYMSEQKIDVTIHDDNWMWRWLCLFSDFLDYHHVSVEPVESLYYFSIVFFYCMSGRIGPASSGWRHQGSMEVDANVALLGK